MGRELQKALFVACVLVGIGEAAMAAQRAVAPRSVAPPNLALVTDCRRELGPTELVDVGVVRLPSSAQAVFDEAAGLFRQRRYAAAFARFANLADAGHVPSARVALTMLEQGRALFGSEWSASAEQQCRWHVLLFNRARHGLELLDDGRGD